MRRGRRWTKAAFREEGEGKGGLGDPSGGFGEDNLLSEERYGGVEAGGRISKVDRVDPDREWIQVWLATPSD